MPTASRTAVCSLITPAPAYSSGIDQPPNSANFAPSATCRSCNGEVSRSLVGSEPVMAPNLAQLRPRADGRGAAPTTVQASLRAEGRRRRRSPVRLTTYTLSNGAPEKTKADAVAIGVVRTAKGLRAAPGGEGVSSAYGRKFAPLLSTLGFTGKAGEVTRIPSGGVVKSPLLILVGMGPADRVDP